MIVGDSGAVLHLDPFAGPPRLHGARRVGVRPGTEVVHPLAATGLRPMRFDVEGLPGGIDVDEVGILRGHAPRTPGVWPLDVTVTNAAGRVSGRVELVVGDRLALTPPMGWNSWNVFRTDVSAAVIVDVAEALVASGMRDLGYQYVNIDDHWHAERRGVGGVPEPDRRKFPDGIAAVAEHLHRLGLKLGIYSDAAHLTCGNCFGGYGFEDIDARTYAEWGVDLLKYDYCHAPPSAAAARQRYATMGRALERSGRSIVFSVCEWGFRRPWRWAQGVGGAYWRTTGDIFDTFTAPVVGVRSIARRNASLHRFAGPGAWNDPDMLLVGNRGRGLSTGALRPVEGWRISRPLLQFRGLDDAQARTHMTLWAMMAAPLLASHDPTAISGYDLALLTNPEVIAVNQDPLGAQARPRGRLGSIWELSKSMADGSTALSISNMGRRRRTVPLRLGWLGSEPRSIREAWSGAERSPEVTTEVELDGYESVLLLVDPVSPHLASSRLAEPPRSVGSRDA